MIKRETDAPLLLRRTFRSKTYSRRSVWVLLLLLCATLARSQEPLVSFDKLFDQFNGIAIWGAVSPPKQRDQGFTTSKFLGSTRAPVRYGFELLLGPYPGKESNPLLDSLKNLRKAWMVAQYARSRDMATTISLDDRIDTLLFRPEWNAKALRTEARNDSLSLLSYAIKSLEARDKLAEDGRWHFEGGFGIDFSNSYRRTTDSNDLRIPVRGPYLSAYILPPLEFWNISPYFGSVIGFYSISNGTLFKVDSTRTQLPVTASSLGFEATGGLSLKLGSAQLQLEVGYQYLVFEGVQYGDKCSPGAFAPRSINLSAWYITFGIQGARKE